jgi:hypothetical protein
VGVRILIFNGDENVEGSEGQMRCIVVHFLTKMDHSPSFCLKHPS